MNRLFSLSPLWLPPFLALGVLLAPAVNAASDPEETLRRFAESVKADETLDAGAQEEALELVEAILAEETVPPGAIAEALGIVYPEFVEAVRLSTEGDGKEGFRKLNELTRHENRFLAAESAYFLARVLSGERRYEEALPYLDRLRENFADHTLRTGDILFYQGMAQANGLAKDEAIETLSQFLEDYPDASERLRIMAQGTLDGIANIPDGSIDDIADHMHFSYRRLDFADTGDRTQEVQEKIVAMLDHIIEEAEKQQQQQQQQAGAGQGQGQGQARGQQAQGAGEQAGGNASAQDDPKTVRKIRGAAKSAWDDLRDRERKADALSGLKSTYPPRYRELVEQYFSDLQKGEEGEATADDANEP